ncbi:MAG: ABC transporter ATP-binding protein [Deltaproteobacteria bacterium]|nr:ABC transporter ATP-binding protein [Deltaproteobacteria bacterium]
MKDSAPILEIRNISKEYPGVTAIDNVSLKVHQHEFVSIIGPSGCGKSTLLEIIAGLLAKTSGEVFIKGHAVKNTHASIGIVFQQESIFPWRSTLENIEFGLEMHGVSKQERRNKSRRMIEIVGLQGFEDRYPGELSGGMKQRVAIARALVMEPEILLMDEPFGALDEQTRIILGEELLRIQQEIGQTILFVTHNIHEAVQLSDRVVVITARPGKIKATISVDIERPRTSEVIALEKFGKLVGKIWMLLREESLKGFKQTAL